MDDDDDGSDWDVDDGDCSSDTSRDDDKGSNGDLATLFQELRERAVSKKASCSTT